MSDPLFRLHNAIGEFLGYGGCPVCGRTYFGVGDDLKEAFHWIDLPSTWRYEHAPRRTTPARWWPRLDPDVHALLGRPHARRAHGRHGARHERARYAL